jgi:[lysine-biosynthesis-protein LysW]---L-2-aminoadipate ligase
VRTDLIPQTPLPHGERGASGHPVQLPSPYGGGVVALLAPRLRVEERQLMAAFAARGWETSLLALEDVSVSLCGGGGLPSLIVDRGVATHDRAIFAALVSAGSVVVNRTATTRLLADRLAFTRHMLVAGVPVPETAVGFGEQGTLRALEQVGYPATLVAMQSDASRPDAVVHDADAAEAIVEHRSMLAHESTVLVQQLVSGHHLRVAVAGTEVIGVEAVSADARGVMRYEPVGWLAPAIERMAEQVISRLGSGVYEIRVTEGVGGPVVTSAGNLVDFRSLSAAGIDVAGQIADFALAQIRSNDRELVAQHG